MEIEYAQRFNNIPPYLFAGLERKLAEMQARGIDVIPLGIGDPDLPTPQFIREAMAQEVLKPSNHRYPESMGQQDFRNAVSEWMKKRFGVEVDPDREVNSLIGTKEGLANIARAFVDTGDKVLCPNPGYAVYTQGATILCDGVPVQMPLLEADGFLPDLERISRMDLSGAKLIYLNYPNNPTGAIATDSFLKNIIEFCLEHNLILVYDNAYSEFYFDGIKARSILEFEGARECAVEMHSLSKTFCMTGDRLGFAVGNEKIISGLRKIKNNIDSGCQQYVQRAGVVALQSYRSAMRPPEVEEIISEYSRRRDLLDTALRKYGFEARKPPATFYYWLKLPQEYARNSAGFAGEALKRGVMITPGAGFGECGEGYVRFALTQPASRLQEAVERIAGIL